MFQGLIKPHALSSFQDLVACVMKEYSSENWKEIWSEGSEVRNIVDGNLQDHLKWIVYFRIVFMR
jgi:hypothetical protein